MWQVQIKRLTNAGSCALGIGEPAYISKGTPIQERVVRQKLDTTDGMHDGYTFVHCTRFLFRALT